MNRRCLSTQIFFNIFQQYVVAQVLPSFCYIYCWVFYSIDALMNRTLNFIFDCSQVLCRSTIDFGILLLYSTTWMGYLLALRSLCVCVCSLGFSLYKVVLSVNRGSFIFPFPVQMHFVTISMACLQRNTVTLRILAWVSPDNWLFPTYFFIQQFRPSLLTACQES